MPNSDRKLLKTSQLLATELLQTEPAMPLREETKPNLAMAEEAKAKADLVMMEKPYAKEMEVEMEKAITEIMNRAKTIDRTKTMEDKLPMMETTPVMKNTTMFGDFLNSMRILAGSVTSLTPPLSNSTASRRMELLEMALSASKTLPALLMMPNTMNS